MKKPTPKTQDHLTADVVKLANKLATLTRKRRDQLRALRETNGLLRQTRRELKAVAQSLSQPDPLDQLPPTRFDGE